MDATLVGEAACLTAAALWAVAVTLFRRPVAAVGAPALNVVKCVLAATLQGLTLLALGRAGDLFSTSAIALAWIAASGVVGLVIGDTALFAGLARLGPHRTLLLQTLAPVFAALLAASGGEHLRLAAYAGSALVLVGIATVVAPGRHPGLPWSRAGIAFATLAAFGQGAGVVLAKVGMEEMPVLAASVVRLVVAAVGLVAIAGLRGLLPRAVEATRSPLFLVRTLPAILLGTYLALILMMAGVALAPASVAAVLLSTSPLFSLAIEATVGRRKIRWREILGTLVAVSGVAMLVGA